MIMWFLPISYLPFVTIIFLLLLQQVVPTSSTSSPSSTPSLPLHVDVNETDGSYVIKVGISDDTSNLYSNITFVTWLVSDVSRIGKYNTNDGSLLLAKFEQGNGWEDDYGPFEYTLMGWSAAPASTSTSASSKSSTTSTSTTNNNNDTDKDDILMYTSFLRYPNEPSIIIMKQYFPQKFVVDDQTYNHNVNSSSSSSSLTLFPSFTRNTTTTTSTGTKYSQTHHQYLSCVSYHGVFPKMVYHRRCSLNYKSSRVGGIPLVVYNETHPSLPTMIISPITNIMASSIITTSKIFFGLGIKNTVQEIPAGWTQHFLLIANYGIYNSFQSWGDTVIKLRRKYESVFNDTTSLLYPPDPSTMKVDEEEEVDEYTFMKEVQEAKVEESTFIVEAKEDEERLIPTTTNTTIQNSTTSSSLSSKSSSSLHNTTHSDHDNVNHHDDSNSLFNNPRAVNFYRDAVHSKIGFWTDNGGYYHYNTGNKKQTYEQVLPKVKQYHDDLNIPFGHWQLDSWFYPKDGAVNRGGGGGAVVNWTSMDSVFPSGMVAFQNSIGLPMVMHNRQFSTTSDYIKHWKDIEWYTTGPRAAIPHNPEIFYRKFFTQQVGWGLSMYEQDWMNVQYDGTEELLTNISLADLWLQGMAIGAAANNLTIQYCMPYPNQVLASAGFSHIVTNARASVDYWPKDSTQWQIGPTSLFYWALGILPFKDGFYSSTKVQKGGFPKGPEHRPDLQALIATLSCAMVGAMDGIHLMNATRVKTSCRSDGTILKPDEPIRTSDACFYQSPSRSEITDPAQCHIYITHSDVPKLGRVRYLFIKGTDTTGMTLSSMVHLDDDDEASSNEYAIYDWYNRDLLLLQDANNKVKPGYEGHSYSIITPIMDGGWIFLGEVDKYVPISRLRFSKITTSVGGDKLEVMATGVPDEETRICFARTPDLQHIHCETIRFESEFSQMIQIGEEELTSSNYYTSSQRPNVLLDNYVISLNILSILCLVVIR